MERRDGHARGRWRRKFNTELQCVSFPPVLSSCPHPSEGSSVPLCRGPEGEQGRALCTPYLVRGSVSPQAVFHCVFLGLDVSPGPRRPVCSCATGKFTVKEEYLDSGCEVGRLSRSQKAMTERSVKNVTQILCTHYMFPSCRQEDLML